MVSLPNATSSSNYRAIHEGICGIQASTNASISGFAASIRNMLRTLSQNSVSKADLNNAVDSLNSKLAALTNLSYAALIVALGTGLAAIVISRRKWRRSN